MEFFRRAGGSPARLGVFPGAFNPPTCAHLALAGAALAHVDEVVFVLPRVFPHKQWHGAGFEDRVRLLRAALADRPRCSIAASGHGLFIEIARECREHYPAAELWFLCGADAAERILAWDYGAGEPIEAQMREYGLLVAPRRTPCAVPEPLRGRVRFLELAGWEDVSSTEVRERIRRGEPWRHLVPAGIVPLVEQLY